MARPYNKKSSYWNQRQAAKASEQTQSDTTAFGASPSLGGTIGQLNQNGSADAKIDYDINGGDSYMYSEASYASQSSYRAQTGATDQSIFSNAFPNLAGGILPYANTNAYLNITECIKLCQQAYANVAVFKNTIDVMTEFSTAKIHLRGGSEASRSFFYKWFEKINLDQLKEEFFREYYRSGNVFLYKIDGKFANDDYIKLVKTGVTKDKIPLRYIIINPATVAIEGGIGYAGRYLRMLSRFEIERLRQPVTDEEKAVYNALDATTKSYIKASVGAAWREIYVAIEPMKLSYVFYKKQSYEPFAVPMGFPVLHDIEHKLQLKKMDIALTRTIENVILLVTMGAKKDDGGINYQNIKALQELFANRAAGRVIVSDYTTEAKFITPEISEILGKDKYEVVNQDIQDGLQNILIGGEKFANQFIKTKVFLERLKEGQKAFVRNFLMVEMRNLAESMNFRTCPIPIFEKMDLKDEIQHAKVITRLAEIGLLTDKQAFNTMESGLLPDPDSMVSDQEEFKALRDKGLYQPLLGGQKDNAEGRPAGAKAPQTTKNVKPIGSGNSKSGKASILKMIFKKSIRCLVG